MARGDDQSPLPMASYLPRNSAHDVWESAKGKPNPVSPSRLSRAQHRSLVATAEAASFQTRNHIETASVVAERGERDCGGSGWRGEGVPCAGPVFRGGERARARARDRARALPAAKGKREENGCLRACASTPTPAAPGTGTQREPESGPHAHARHALEVDGRWMQARKQLRVSVVQACVGKRRHARARARRAGGWGQQHKPRGRMTSDCAHQSFCGTVQPHTHSALPRLIGATHTQGLHTDPCEMQVLRTHTMQR
jgi:hypothetical protein